jgi:hypothetical protein
VRAVAGRPNKVRFRFEAEDGALEDVDSSTEVDVVVKAGDGSQLATGTAVLDGSNTGIYAYTLPAQANLDVLTATATGTVGGQTITVAEEIKLVDRRIVPLSVLRQDSVLSALTVMDFLDVVDRAEDAIETELNFSPVLAGVRAEWRSRACTRLFIPGIYYPQSVYALTRNDEDQLSNQVSAEAVKVRDNALERGYGANFGTSYYDPLLGINGVPWLPGVYKAWLSAGWTNTPGDLGGACVLLARHYAQNPGSSYPDRATRVMTEQTDIWFARMGPESPFGIPEVDAAIVRYRMPEPTAGRSRRVLGLPDTRTRGSTEVRHSARRSATTASMADRRHRGLVRAGDPTGDDLTDEQAALPRAASQCPAGLASVVDDSAPPARPAPRAPANRPEAAPAGAGTRPV